MVRSFSVPITIPLIEWGRSVSKKKPKTSKASMRRKFIVPDAAIATPYIHVEPKNTEPLVSFEHGPDVVIHSTLAPAPQFLFTDEGCFAHLYQAHYDRLVAVVEAAKSGNKSLIRMALAELDRLGSSKEV
jgi:hypothetical protein